MNSDYKMEISSEAKKYLKKLDKPNQQRIIVGLEELVKDPFNHINTKKMKGYTGEFYRLRVGNYRIIYEIVNNMLLIIVVKIGSRGDVYK